MSFHSFTACTKGHEGNKKEHSDGRARDSEMECLQLSTSLNFDKNFQKFKKKKKKKKKNPVHVLSSQIINLTKTICFTGMRKRESKNSRDLVSFFKSPSH